MATSKNTSTKERIEAVELDLNSFAARLAGMRDIAKMLADSDDSGTIGDAIYVLADLADRLGDSLNESAARLGEIAMQCEAAA